MMVLEALVILELIWGMVMDPGIIMEDMEWWSWRL